VGEPAAKGTIRLQVTSSLDLAEGVAWSAVEATARELCASEGWNPDERILCDPVHAVHPTSNDAGTDWTCARWELYARAANSVLHALQTNWDTF
jgi:hypothetical protein